MTINSCLDEFLSNLQMTIEMEKLGDVCWDQAFKFTRLKLNLVDYIEV
jgi:hypothetical protein